jgi:hypothetical protein
MNKMELIERYIYQVGKRLPSKNRADIVSELRSSFEDQLDARAVSEPSEAQVIELLNEMGSPESVAASYFPEGQYLIGPTLYPLFRMVVGIVLAAVIVAQLIGIAAGVIFSQGSFNPLQTLLTLLTTVPIVIGWLVIVFAILQRFGVEPDSDDEPFDPRQLPAISGEKPVSRGEQIFRIVFGVALLTALIVLYGYGPGEASSEFLAIPAINQYLPWISLVLVFGILIDIVILWHGEWRGSTRIAKLVNDLVGLLLLGLMIQRLTSLLSAAGVAGFADGVALISAGDEASMQLAGMVFLRIPLIVAFIVTGIEAVVQVVGLVQERLRKDQLGSTGLADA